MAAVLTFSSLTVFCVGAEEPEGLEVEVEAESTASASSSQPMIYNAGEEIKVTLRIGRNTGVTSVMLYIDYDETVLELIEYTAAGLLTEDDSLTAYSTSKGDAYLAFYSENYPQCILCHRRAGGDHFSGQGGLCCRHFRSGFAFPEQ